MAFFASSSSKLMLSSMAAMAVLLATATMAAGDPSRRQLATVVKCPTSPRRDCDFYFQGFKNTVPTFSLEGRADTALSKPIVEGRNNTLALVSTSGVGAMYCGKLKSSDDHFYVTDFPSTLKFRTFNAGKDMYKNSCIKLPFRGVTIGQSLNLNVNDKNKVYPEARRCVVFKTGPSGCA